MCIPHGAMGTKSNGYIKTKSKKHISKMSKEQFEKGDPDFIDQRIDKYTPKKREKSFWEGLF